MRFFILENPGAGTPHDTRIDEQGLKTGEITKTCPACGRGAGSREWLPPHQIVVMRHGKDFGDIVIGSGEDCFVSEIFRKAWLSEHLKGIDVFGQIDIVRVRPPKAMRLVPIYWHVIPQLVPGAIDLLKSHLLMDGSPECIYCRGSVIVNGIGGLSLNESMLQGQDLFRPLNLPGSIIVSERFAEMVHKHRLTNALMIPVEQYLWDPLHKIVPYSKHKN